MEPNQCHELLKQCYTIIQTAQKKPLPIWQTYPDLPLYILAFAVITYTFVYVIYLKAKHFKYQRKYEHVIELGKQEAPRERRNERPKSPAHYSSLRE